MVDESRVTHFGNRSKTRGVIAGLVPAISIRMAQVPDYRDGRDKPGHDQVELPRVLPPVTFLEEVSIPHDRFARSHNSREPPHSDYGYG